MKLFLFLILFSLKAFCLDQCFTYKIKDQIKSEGQCQKRYPPQSTFKMVISMMGFDAGILKDATHPVMPFKEGYPDSLESWKSPQEPTSWIKNSCVWYSQFITRELGLEKFKKYLKQFNYGNQDVSGTKSKPDGLTSSWITSSLAISPEEQINFIEAFLNSKLGIKKEAEAFTKEILFLEDLGNGWKFYGKTGTGDLLNKDGTNSKELERGWFVGWTEKGNQRIIFAQYLEVKNIKTKENNFSYVASKNAKALAKEKVIALTKSL